MSNYDEGFASAFIQFLDKAPDTLQPSLEDSFGDNFLEYIKAHLQTQSCPSPCSRLWSVDYLLLVMVWSYCFYVGGTVQTTNCSLYLNTHLKDY